MDKKRSWGVTNLGLFILFSNALFCIFASYIFIAENRVNSKTLDCIYSLEGYFAPLAPLARFAITLFLHTTYRSILACFINPYLVSIMTTVLTMIVATGILFRNNIARLLFVIIEIFYICAAWLYYILWSAVAYGYSMKPISTIPIQTRLYLMSIPLLHLIYVIFFIHPKVRKQFK